MKILVTHATRNSAMAVINELARGGREVVGADDRRLPLYIHSMYTKPYYLYPDAKKENGFVDAIIKIIKKGNPDVILPINGTKLISKHRKEIERFIKLLMSDYESYVVTRALGRTPYTHIEARQVLGVL